MISELIIIVVVVPPIEELDLVGPMQVFSSVNRLAGRAIYSVEVVTTAKRMEVKGEGGIAGEGVGQDFDGDVAVEFGIYRTPNLTHSALAELAREAIVADCPLGAHRRRDSPKCYHIPTKLRANRTELFANRCMVDPWRWRPRVMKQNQKRNAKRRAAKSVLRLPDLEVAKSAVLNSLSCPDAQRGYRTRSASSWTGIVPCPGCRSAKP